jgi:hypothetical protein
MSLFAGASEFVPVPAQQDENGSTAAPQNSASSPNSVSSALSAPESAALDGLLARICGREALCTLCSLPPGSGNTNSGSNTSGGSSSSSGGSKASKQQPSGSVRSTPQARFVLGFSFPCCMCIAPHRLLFPLFLLTVLFRFCCFPQTPPNKKCTGVVSPGAR